MKILEIIKKNVLRYAGEVEKKSQKKLMAWVNAHTWYN